MKLEERPAVCALPDPASPALPEPALPEPAPPPLPKAGRALDDSLRLHPAATEAEGPPELESERSPLMPSLEYAAFFVELQCELV